MSRPSRHLAAWRALSWALATLLPAAGLTAAPQDGATAQDPAAAERAATLRATFVLKMAPYMAPETAPKTPPKTYRIALVGDDAVTQVAAKALAGKKVDDRAVEIVVVPVADAVAGKGTANCDLMYVAANVDAERLKKVVQSHTDKPVPIVCERAGFAGGGGGVQLFVQDNLIRFEVNAEALKKQGMRASPQLLKLSRKGPA